ncbi:MAG TPA: phage tail protein [Terriglobales bacterium]|nr:phage tail protein [Terriglobales bacterium]
MGLSRGKGGKSTPLAQQQTILSAIRVQTANFGSAETLVYGQQRVSGKLLDYTDFLPIPHTSTTRTGGKGGGGGQTTTTTTYTYQAACVIGICAGPITALKNVWDTKGKLALVSGSSTYTIPVGGGSYTPTIPSSGQYHVDEGAGYYSPYSFSANDYGSDGSRLYSGTQTVPLRYVASAPAAGQYSASGGTYTFAAADAGKQVVLNYVYSVPDSSGDASAPATKLSLSLFTGDLGQAPWGYMSSKHPDRALGYSGMAYVASSAFDLGSSASLPNYSYEVAGLLQFGAGIVDANPADVVNDIITNPYHGTTFPSANLGSLTQYSNYCVANGLFLSPVIDSQTTAGDIINQITSLTNTAVVWSEGKLKFIPYGDTTAVGNGATFTPNTTPVYDLTDSDFICNTGEEPITISIVPPEEQYNVCKLEILDRSNSYNPLPIEDKDDAAIQVNGLRTQSVITAHEICDSGVGKKVAMAINRRTCYITRQLQFKLGLKYILLEPMDLVTVTDSRLGLNQYPVRILSIEEDEDGLLQITAEEFPWGTATATEYPAQSPSSYSPNTGVDPGSINTPIIFEATDRLSEYRGNEIIIAASGSNANWGGCNVWVSPDGTTYKQIEGGTISSPARMGVLTAPLASGSDPDTTHTLSVDLTQSRGTLSSGTVDDCDNFRTLCWVDGELISYQTATLTSAYHYNLGTKLHRGVYGSTIGSHASGAQFVFLDGAVLSYNYDPTWAGKTIYLKFTSFNSFGGGEQSLGSVTPYTFTIPGVYKGAVNSGTGVVVPTSVDFSQGYVNQTLDYIADGTTRKLGNGYVVKSRTSNFSTVAWDVNLVNTGTSTVTGTLPAAGTNDNNIIIFKKVSADSNTLIINPIGGDTIEGTSNLVLNYKNSCVTLISDGTSNWDIL